VNPVFFVKKDSILEPNGKGRGRLFCPAGFQAEAETGHGPNITGSTNLLYISALVLYRETNRETLSSLPQ
jgi:hypothetical protein